MKSIPTLYRGIQMRSRLEAKWACYWDLRGDTKWEYEPVDFPGWIPDFTILIPGAPKPTLVEIKPINAIEQFYKLPDSAKMLKALNEDLTQMQPYLGIVIFGMSPDYSWFFGSKGDAACIWEQLPKHPPGMRQLWAQACNTVQWKPRA